MNNDIFYKQDERIGSYCTINGKDVYNLFNADLKSITPTASKITTNFSKAVGVSNLHINSYVIDTGGIKLVFYVGGMYKEDCYINTSNLISECKNCIIKTSEDSFEYVSVMTDFDVKETGVEFYNEVTITFSAIKRLPVVTKEVKSGDIIKNIGSIESGAKYIITPQTSITIFTINDITIKNLSSNLQFIIDGLNGEVKCNGINRFLDTDLVNFPKVTPGDNTINYSVENAKVEVIYYPTFII